MFHPQNMLFYYMKRVSCDFALSLNTGGGHVGGALQPWLCEGRLYLQHLGEEGDHANHDEEQADAINLTPLNHRICDRKGLQTHSRAAHVSDATAFPFTARWRELAGNKSSADICRCYKLLNLPDTLFFRGGWSLNRTAKI